MGDEPPKLTLASSQDRAGIERERSLDSFEWAVREFVANLLRVMRGAGRPYKIFDDLNELLARIKDMDGVSVFDASERFRETLQSALRPDIDDEGIPEARKMMARGVLQMLASELVGQATQKRAGESELHEGVKAMEEVREANRRRWQAEWAKIQPKRKSKAARARVVRAIVAGRSQPAAEDKDPKAPQQPPAPVSDQERGPTGTAAFMRRRNKELRGNE